jgi:hypothetical protein
MSWTAHVGIFVVVLAISVVSYTEADSPVLNSKQRQELMLYHLLAFTVYAGIHLSYLWYA